MYVWFLSSKATKIILCISSIWVFFCTHHVNDENKYGWIKTTSNLLKIKRIWSRPEDRGFCVWRSVTLIAMLYHPILPWYQCKVFWKVWLCYSMTIFLSSCKTDLSKLHGFYDKKYEWLYHTMFDGLHLRPPWGSVNLIFTKLNNLVSL